jgi:hypothetical protein
MLARVLTLKILRDRVEDGLLLGILPRNRAEPLMEATEKAWSEASTTALRRLGYAVSRQDKLQSILGPSEQVVGTCYFANYYTFATGERAARRMFEDTNEIATIRQMLRDGTGYQDLVLLSGNCLVLEAQAEDASAPVADVANEMLLDVEVKKELERGIAEDIERLITQHFPHPTVEEAEVLDSLRTATRNAFSRSIFKNR